jgi:hypothetical protein
VRQVQQRAARERDDGAGLARALAEFPDDVAFSAKQAADVAQKIKRPADPTAEPWPPMKAGTTL